MGSGQNNLNAQAKSRRENLNAELVRSVLI